MRGVFPSGSFIGHGGERLFVFVMPAAEKPSDVVVGFDHETGCGSVRFRFRKEPKCRLSSFSSRCGGYDPDLLYMAAKIAASVSFEPNSDGTFTFRSTSTELPLRLVEAALPV